MNVSGQSASKTCGQAGCSLPSTDLKEGLCILHSKNAKKDKTHFDGLFAQKLAANDFDFRGTFFPENVDFSSRVIYNANFREANFEGGASFVSARFEGVSTFLNANFHQGVSFENALFANFANFNRCQFPNPSGFGHTVGFENTQFLGPVLFAWASFGGVNFANATFADWANFISADFVGVADFRGVRFRQSADFTMAIFRGKDFFLYGSPFKLKCIDAAATFFEASFEGAAYFSACSFNNVVDFELSQFHDSAIFALNRTPGSPKLCFEGVVCESPERVSFDRFDASSTTFLHTDLRKIRFHSVNWPRFDSRVCLYDEQRNRAATGERLVLVNEQQDRESIRLLYRDLKVNLESSGDWVGAGDFYYAEMELARRYDSNKTNRWLLWTYKFLAGYGERPLQALSILGGLLLVLSVLFLLPWSSFTFELTPHNVVDWHLSPTEAFSHSLRAIFLRSPFFQPQTKWANGWTLIGNIVGPIQLALLAIALRRWLRR
jgi:uncharacterized protein YjbI with pentapeptide repeats